MIPQHPNPERNDVVGLDLGSSAKVEAVPAAYGSATKINPNPDAPASLEVPALRAAPSWSDVLAVDVQYRTDAHPVCVAYRAAVEARFALDVTTH